MTFLSFLLLKLFCWSVILQGWGVPVRERHTIIRIDNKIFIKLIVLVKRYPILCGALLWGWEKLYVVGDGEWEYRQDPDCEIK